MVADKIGRRPLLLITGIALRPVFYLAGAGHRKQRAGVLIALFVHTNPLGPLWMQRPGISAMAIDLAPKGNWPRVIAIFRVVGATWAGQPGPALGRVIGLICQLRLAFGLSTILTALVGGGYQCDGKRVIQKITRRRRRWAA